MSNFAKGALILAAGVGLVVAIDSSTPTSSPQKAVTPQVTQTEQTPVSPTPTVKKVTPQQNCNPNYSGCLRADASDYDCAGGSGNGPYYTGRVQVIGYDEYGLDRDGDGVGCE